MNTVHLIGRLGKDPETRKFDKGQLTNVSMATSRKYTDKQGERQEVTQWHNLVFRGKLSEIAEKYLTKGALIAVTGEINYRSWEKDGITRYATEIVVFQMQMLGGEQKSQELPQQAYKPQESAASQAAAQMVTDDLPFIVSLALSFTFLF